MSEKRSDNRRPQDGRSGGPRGGKGKGAPRVKGEGTGDLKVRIDVQVPKAMSEGQKKAMEDFLAATTDDVRSWQ